VGVGGLSTLSGFESRSPPNGAVKEEILGGWWMRQIQGYTGGKKN